MTLIEIAAFRLESKEIKTTSTPFLADAPTDQPTATLRFYLSHAIRVLSKNAKHPFHLVQDLNNPLLIYYIGNWTDIGAYIRFHESKDRKELLDDLNGCEAVMVWSGFYSLISYEHWEESVSSALLHKEKSLNSASLVSITRINVAPEDEYAFGRAFRETMPHIEKFSGHRGATGWKAKPMFDFEVDDEATPVLDEEELALVRSEFVILGGWDSKEQYDSFPDSEEYMKYVKMRDSAKWFERRIGKVIRLE